MARQKYFFQGSFYKEACRNWLNCFIGNNHQTVFDCLKNTARNLVWDTQAQWVTNPATTNSSAEYQGLLVLGVQKTADQMAAFTDQLLLGQGEEIDNGLNGQLQIIDGALKDPNGNYKYFFYECPHLNVLCQPEDVRDTPFIVRGMASALKDEVSMLGEAFPLPLVFWVSYKKNVVGGAGTLKIRKLL
jgi:hypothetical protein